MKVNVLKNSRSLTFELIAIVVLAISSVRSDESYNRDATRPEVTIPVGSLRGVQRTTLLGRSVSAFLGVPYAQPPVGELRFEAPVASAAWNGTLEADSDGPMCPQYVSLFDTSTDIVGNEDCLYLNVFTPDLPDGTDAKLRPTMVHIFGGVFKGGSAISSTYGPQYMLDEDVVLVVPSYRLGVLGFLSTGDEAAPGNYALKDLVLAFQWVRDNIEYFGGDPNRVTLFGHSSGAAAAHILALSPSMNGLFHRLITQSSSGLADWSWSNRTTYKQRAYDLGKSVGCSSTISSELIACLKKTSVSALISYAPSGSTSFLTFDYIIWVPTDEPDISGAIITDSPKNLFAAGKIPDVPWMTGVTRDEAVSMIACFDYFADTIEDYIEKAIDFVTQSYGTNSIKTMFSNYVKAYLNTLSEGVDAIVANISVLLGDYFYTYPVWNAVQKQVALAKNPTYFYTFNYVGTFSQTQMSCGTTVHGVGHADELTYLWDFAHSTYQSLNTSLSATDLEMIRIMVPLWTSFATNGVPLTSPETGTTIWKPYTLKDKNVLRIGEGSSVELEAQHSFQEPRMRFWQIYYAITS